MEITTKRIYEQPLQSDGYRVLVDRLWPRGMSKEKRLYQSVGQRTGSVRRPAQMVRTQGGKMGSV